MAEQTHGMVPGTHERPDGPECRCGAPWSIWADRCAAVSGSCEAGEQGK